MEFGIISDTHDNVAAIDAGMDVFEEHGLDVVLHCGDFIAPPTIPHLDRDGIEIHAVRGNNDGEREGLLAAFDDLEDGTYHGRVAELDFDGADVVMLHGEDRVVIDALAESGSYDYVCHGHWHVREERSVEGTTVINPGAHFPTVESDHRTVAVVDTEADQIEFVRV